MKDDTKNFSTLLAALEPHRAGYTEVIYAHLKREVDGILSNLAQHDNDADAAADYPTSNMGRVEYIRRVALHKDTLRWSDADTTRVNGPRFVRNGMWTQKNFRKHKSAEQIRAALMKQADEITKGDFAAYASKLSQKIGKEIESAEIKGQLWSLSVLRVVIAEDFWTDTATQETQCWQTKMILNRSKLGKIFNQWPTLQKN